MELPPGAELRAEGATVGLAGAFNPTIFRPSWFARWHLISDEAAEGAKINIIHPEVVDFDLEWMNIQVTNDRLYANVDQPSDFDRFRDLMLGTFRLLSHTPIKGVEVQWRRHCQFEEDVVPLLERLAPTAHLQQYLDGATFRTLRLEAPHAGDENGIRVSIEPSHVFAPGIYISMVTRHVAPDEDAATEATWLAQRLEREWDQSRLRAESFMVGLLRFAAGLDDAPTSMGAN